MLVVKNLSKDFPNQPGVLKNISFTIYPGEITALIGASGSGKSTLIGAIMGLRRFQGSISLFGQDIAQISQNHQIGFVPQEDLFDEELSCLENLLTYGAFFPHLDRLKERAFFLLEKFELIERAQYPIHTLSGGMKRRLSLARALMADPRVLILDEFSSGLDPKTKEDLWYFLKKVHTPERITLFVSHDIEEIKILAHKIILIQKGSLIGEGSLQKIQEECLGPSVWIFDHTPHIKETLKSHQIPYVEEEGELWVLEKISPIGGEQLVQMGLSFRQRDVMLKDLFTFFH